EPAVVQAQQPIVGAEGDRQCEKRKTRERNFAQPNGKPRIPVFVLAHGKTTQQLRREDKKPKEEDRSQDKEIQVQVSPLRIEVWFFSGRNVHPFVEMMAQQEDRDEKERENGKEDGDIFELAANNHGPFRVHRVMHNGPEETARAKREEKPEREQPRVTELLRINRSARAAERQSNECDYAKNNR